MNWTVRDNQTLVDVALQTCGTMEALSYIARANDIAPSAVPDAGTVLIIPDNAPTDPVVLKVIADKKLMIATANVPPLPQLTADFVLYPKMNFVARTVGAPHSGSWQYKLIGADDFVNLYDLVADYLTDNKVYAQTEDYIVSGASAISATPDVVTLMSSKVVNWDIPWSNPALGYVYLLVWSDVALGDNTTTVYKDVNGNQAHVAPLLIIDNLTQNLIQYMLASVTSEVLSATGTHTTVRITRYHADAIVADFADMEMEWIGNMAGALVEDPANAGNVDIRLAVLPAGTHIIGVRTAYAFPDEGVTWPPSEFTAVLEVAASLPEVLLLRTLLAPRMGVEALHPYDAMTLDGSLMNRLDYASIVTSSGIATPLGLYMSNLPPDKVAVFAEPYHGPADNGNPAVDWSNLDPGAITLEFVDINGNLAHCAPVVLFGGVKQAPIEVLDGRIDVIMNSSTSSDAGITINCIPATIATDLVQIHESSLNVLASDGTVVSTVGDTSLTLTLEAGIYTVVFAQKYNSHNPAHPPYDDKPLAVSSNSLVFEIY
jgi:hypothetical protein